MTDVPPAKVTYTKRAVYLDDADALVFADLHVGRDASSNVGLPLGEREDLVGRLRSLLDRFAPAEVVVAGDLLHSFDSVPPGVADTVHELVDVAESTGASVTVTPGNHDQQIGAIPDVPRTSEYRLGDTVVCHGHELPERDADRYVVGHEHPALVVEGVRRPCFLFGQGTYRGADVLVLPAFTTLAAGTPVNDLGPEEALSPLLAEPGAFRPIVSTEREPLSFPPLGDFRGLL